MKQEYFVNMFCAVAGLCAISSDLYAGNRSVKESQRKNVLMIAIDDMKPLIGCYGDEYACTPNMDYLGSRASIFTAAYCQQAISGPSRASLLTGFCPDRTRVWDLKTLIRDVNPQVVTLPQYFIEQGYNVAGIGKIFDYRSVDAYSDSLSWSIPFFEPRSFLKHKDSMPVAMHYLDAKIRQDYECWMEIGRQKGLCKQELRRYALLKVKRSTECLNVEDDEYVDGAIAKGAVQFLKDYKSGTPFFLAVGFNKPHLPFCAPKKYWDLYQRDQFQLATYQQLVEEGSALAYHNCGELRGFIDIAPESQYSKQTNLVLSDFKQRELIHGYYACISYIDAQIGKVLDALRERGDLENTIIVLWGDHGWHLGDHRLWGKHTNFEQATRVPYMIMDASVRPQKIDAPVELLTVYPTLCELAGLEVPKNLDGQSVAGLMKTGQECQMPTYAVSQFPRGNRMGYSLRTAQYRYTVWVEWKGEQTNFEQIVAEELYDYKQDAEEKKNLVRDTVYRNELNQMKSLWIDFKSTRCSMNLK